MGRKWKNGDYVLVPRAAIPNCEHHEWIPITGVAVIMDANPYYHKGDMYEGCVRCRIAGHTTTPDGHLVNGCGGYLVRPEMLKPAREDQMVAALLAE